MQPITTNAQEEQKPVSYNASKEEDKSMDSLVQVIFSMSPYRTMESEQQQIKKLQEDLNMARRVTDVSVLLRSLEEKS